MQSTFTLLSVSSDMAIGILASSLFASALVSEDNPGVLSWAVYLKDWLVGKIEVRRLPHTSFIFCVQKRTLDGLVQGRVCAQFCVRELSRYT